MSDPRLRVIRAGAESDESAILGALDQTVRVALPAGTPSWEHQVLALALVDLLGRLFPRIAIDAEPRTPAHHALPPGPTLFAERLQSARAHGIGPKESGEPVVTIGVGPDAGAADVYVDGRGWISYVGTDFPALEADTEALIPVGPLAAASRGAAQVFGRLLGDLIEPRSPIRSSYWSGLTYETAERPMKDQDVPVPTTVEALLAGAGSVGGAAVYLLARVPGLTGKLDIIDPQELEERNFVRALLATAAAARAKDEKAATAKAALAHQTALQAEAHPKRLAEFVAERPREMTLPLVLCAVDSIHARREIQDSLPLELMNAACSTHEIAVSGHVTDEGPCVYCLYLSQVLDRDRILARLIEQATGLPFLTVVGALVNRAPLTERDLRQIERNRDLHAGALQAYLGRQLDELYRAELLYGEMRVTGSGGGQAAVATPFVTALAGFILGGEAVKAAGDARLARYRLGPRGNIGTKYAESVLHSPNDRIITNPRRTDGTFCLCRSTRRLRLLRERYGLNREETGAAE